ncbi:hypothetical protein H5410_005669 [Solanum commersonii]|uniref:Retrovirus-related Pol polyprotein from transposon TNT 1-94-like beta-barrel domain-containing protein n=1 Tax=Solanum commersonii TaxID=4109 RepID=A0A9J6A837_SOLCO|nr:hypothetical protein H5410_005669 [Solanum commersonii]
MPTSRDIWNSLQRRYMDASQEKSVKLKRQLTTLHKTDSMSVDQYHREAKQIVNSLAAINSPVPSQNLIDHVLLGLGKEYDTSVGIITHFPGVQFAQGGRGKRRSFNSKGRGRGISSAPTALYNSPFVSTFLPSMGVLGPTPSHTAYQICGTPGHSALQCNNCFNHAFISNDLPKSFVAMFVGESNYATCYFDSVASTHMTPSEGYFLHKSIYNDYDLVLVRNGSLLKIGNIGYAQLPTSSRPLILNYIFHVPHLRQNLLSVKKLCKDNDCIVSFDSSSVSIKDKASDQILFQTSSKGDVYPLSP